MKSPQLSRNKYGVALLILFIGLTTTFFVVRSMKSPIFKENRSKKLAHLTDLQGTVLRKMSRKMIWEELQTQSELFEGDTIRTSKDSTAIVQFIDSDTRIEMGADSALVIELAQDDLELSFLKGRLLLSGDFKTDDTRRVFLKSGTERLSLTSARVRVTKTDSQRLDVQVLKGSASVLTDGKEVAVTASVETKLENNSLTPLAGFSEGLTTEDSHGKPLQPETPPPPNNPMAEVESGASHKKLRSPVFLTPSKNQKMRLEEVEGRGIDVQWTSVPGATKYNLLIQRHASFETRRPANKLLTSTKESAVSRFRWTEPEEGNFSLRVAAIDGEGRKGELSDPLPFSIEKLLTIDWTDGKLYEEHIYFTTAPTLRVSWKPFIGRTEIKQWKVRASKDTGAKVEEWVDVSKPEYVKQLEKEGTYSVEVEGVNERGNVIAIALPRRVHLAFGKKLPAPSFTQRLGEVFVTDNRGSIDINWSPVTGADRYIINIHGESENDDKSLETKENKAQVKQLKPGVHFVFIQAIDKYGHVGEESERRKIQVPDLSAIAAPKFKRIKIE